VFPVVSLFRLRVSQHLDPAYVSSPRHVERSARISRLYAHLPASRQGLWDLSCRGNFRLQPFDLVAVEQLQGVIQPLPTPPRPAEALALPSPHHMAPNLLLHPVLNEAEALAGVSDREVIHPAAQYRVDQLDQPICGLGSVAAEYVLELSQQCRSFLEFRRDIRTPDTPFTTDAAKIESQKTEAFTAAKIHDRRVGEDVATLTPHRPGRAELLHPVLHERDSLTAA
jgi:hypothetical protein